jgi:tRNA C32,U32 (ribose-2'-O)-methylase TrmJ
MNLGQAVAVCLYELASRISAPDAPAEKPAHLAATTSGDLELLAGVVEEAMLAANYSPSSMRDANRHSLRLMLRRLALTKRDTRQILGLFRRILWRLGHGSETKKG